MGDSLQGMVLSKLGSYERPVERHGVTPQCPACRAGRYDRCWSVRDGVELSKRRHPNLKACMYDHVTQQTIELFRGKPGKQEPK